MKNILIITIGTRDVQTKLSLLEDADREGKLTWVANPERGFPHIILNADRISIKSNTSLDFDEYRIFQSPRLDAEKLINIPFEKLDWLTFPLIARPLEWLSVNQKTINLVLTVFTNQQEYIDGRENYHWKADTIYFNKLIKQYLHHHPVTANAQQEEYPIENQPVNIDFQYSHFEEAKGGLLATPIEEIENIYLLAQGGIDQINTALTLKLIEHFPNKVVYLQQPEDKPVVPRQFPTLFIRNLTKAKALPALERYEFATIKILVDDPIIKNLAQIGIATKSLNVDSLKEAFSKLFETDFKSIPLQHLQDRMNAQSDDLTKQELLFCNVLVELKIEEYNDALWRLRTLGEILLAPSIKFFLKLDDLSDSKLFTNAILQQPEIEQHLIDKNITQRSGLWEASAFVLRCLFDYQYPKKSGPKALDKAARVLEAVGGIRNQLVHTARPVTLTDIESALQKQGQTLDSVKNYIQQYFESIGILIQGFGIYDTIRDEIKKLL